MNNKENNPSIAYSPPKIRIKGKCRRFMLFVRRIKRIYWIAGLSVALAIYILLMPDNLLVDFLFAILDHGNLIMMMFVFGLLSLSLIWSVGQTIDVAIFKFFNTRGWRPLWLDWFMLGFTQIGNGIATFVIALILFLGINHLLAYELILGTLTLWLVVEIIKYLAKRSRPFSALASARTVGAKERGLSFPSGHTSQVFFVATLLVNYFKTSLAIGLVFYSVAILVGITRMYVGMHYPRDVLAGAMLGTVWGSIGMVINSYIFAHL